MHPLYQGQVSNHNDSAFRQRLLTSWWESTLSWQSPYFHLLEKQERKTNKAPEMELEWQWGGGNGENIYLLSKIIIYKWQKAICLNNYTNLCNTFTCSVNTLRKNCLHTVFKSFIRHPSDLSRLLNIFQHNTMALINFTFQHHVFHRHRLITASI